MPFHTPVELLYAGTHERTLDDKKRVTIPAKWLQEETKEFYTVPKDGEYLVVMPVAEFALQEERIKQQILDPDKQRKAIRFIYGTAQYVTADKQGRILLADDHCKRAGLESKVFLVGSRSRFEIWGASRWNHVSEENASVHAEVAELIGL